VAVVDGQTNAAYLIRTDHIERPVFATDTSGVKVWEGTYLPFGGVHVSTGANIELRFPGQWFQSESGLHQNWMREYDPTTGRYRIHSVHDADGNRLAEYQIDNTTGISTLLQEYVWHEGVPVAVVELEQSKPE
jgi:RHS repeat-associated protein